MKTTSRIHYRLPLFALLLGFVLAWGAQMSRAALPEPPDKMAYQGFLVDADGAALASELPGNYPVVFRIYDASSGGEIIWSEQQIVTVDKGNFSVVLGEGTEVSGEPRPVLSTVFTGATASDRYLGITVTVNGTAKTLAPRLRWLPSPYAFTATAATSLVSASGQTLLSLANGKLEGASELTLNPGPLTVTGNASISGTVSIGNSISPGRLDLTSSTSSASNPAFKVELSGANLLGYRSGASSTTLENTGGGSLNLQTQGGNVGIATSNPTTRLTVVGPGATTPSLTSNSGTLTINNGNDLQLQVGQVNNGGAGVFMQSKRVGNDGSSWQMYLNPLGGNVGIGTTAPDHPLTVSGGNAVAAFVSSGDHAYLRVWDKTGFDNRVEFVSRGNGTAAIWSGYDHLTVLRNGRVGIGTSTPQAILEVAGSVHQNRTFRYLNFGGEGGPATGNVPYSILATHYVGGAEWNSFSDARIKKNIDPTHPPRDLATIQKLQVANYQMVDEVLEGDSFRKGFIAQEVEKVVPEAVHTVTRFVPDIYAIPSAFKFEEAQKELAVMLPKPHKLKKGDLVQIISDDSELKLSVTDVPSETEFVVGKVNQRPEKIFVFGKQVSDFRTLNYDHIFTIGIGAIQELAVQVDALKQCATRISELERQTARMLELEAKASRVDALEKRVQELESVEQQVADLRKLVTELASMNRKASVPVALASPGEAAIAVVNP